MAERTSPTWCDATWNPIQDSRLIESALEMPLHWRKPRRVGVALMGDWMHENLPDEARDRMLAVMALCPHLDFLTLTKRAEKQAEYFRDSAPHHSERDLASTYERVRSWAAQHWAWINPRGDESIPWPPPNVHFGISAEDQETLDARVGWLLKLKALYPSMIVWLSLEPLLGEVDLREVFETTPCGYYCDESIGHVDHRPPLDGVAVGGESGPGARPLHPAWVRRVRDDCVAARVPFMFTGWGAWVDYLDVGATGWDFTRERRGKRYGKLIGGPLHGREFETRYPFRNGCAPGPCMVRVPKEAAGRLLDGRTWDELPEVSR